MRRRTPNELSNVESNQRKKEKINGLEQAFEKLKQFVEETDGPLIDGHNSKKYFALEGNYDKRVNIIDEWNKYFEDGDKRRIDISEYVEDYKRLNDIIDSRNKLYMDRMLSKIRGINIASGDIKKIKRCKRPVEPVEIREVREPRHFYGLDIE